MVDCFFLSFSRLLSWHAGAERRGRLKSKMMIKFSTTQSSAGPTELANETGMELTVSQERLITRSCSTASIWKWVPMMAHTWKSWWL